MLKLVIRDILAQLTNIKIDTRGDVYTMRIKAQVVNKTPILEMANGASESIGYIEANTLVTLVQSKRDGINVYYKMDEYDGYIKRNYLKILRDEEFYYASSLLQKKQNRSKTNRFNMMRKSIAADSTSPEIRSSSSSSISVGYDPMISGGGKGFAGGIDQNNTGGSLIQPYNSNTIGVAATNSTSGPTNGTKVSGTTVVAGILGNMINSKLGGSSNPLATFGSQALSSIVSTGSISGLGNMDIGSALGRSIGGTFGSLLNGASINNLMNGSFFTSGLFQQNAMSLLNNILGTLFQKLDYIVGFNVSGLLVNYLSGLRGINNGVDYLGNLNMGGNNGNTPQLLIRGGDADARIREYFRYRGSRVTMESRGPSELAGGAIYKPINYSTGSLNNTGENPKYVEVHRNLYNNLYTDFAEDLKKVRTSINLNMVRNDWFYNFNRFRLMHPDSVLANTKGYVFFTRPDLNIVSSSVATSEIGLLMYNLSTFHSGIVAGLQKSPRLSNASFDHNHQFIPLLCNRCTGLDVNDETLETKEIGDTYTGWKLNYGTTTIKSKTANTVTTSFIDDEQLSIYLTFKLWEEYISGVTRGVILPFDKYLRSKQLDYAISIYYFLCAEDGESIVFWTKYTGCIPTNVPSSNFTDSTDSPIKQPKYSITWQYAFKKDYDPFSLAEFNHLSDVASGEQAVKIYDKETIRSVRTISGAPYVDTNTGGRLFKLRFRAAKNSFESEYK